MHRPDVDMCRSEVSANAGCTSVRHNLSGRMFSVAIPTFGGDIMSQQIFLRIPNDMARKQIDTRIAARTFDTLYHSAEKRLQWHQANVSTLKIIFASDEVANEYGDIVRRTSVKDISWDTSDLLLGFLKQLRDAIPGFPVLPKEDHIQSSASETQSSRASNPALRAERSTHEVLKWEFYSVIVDDPTLGAHIEKPVYKKTLKELAADGWELVSAVPVIYTEDKSQMFLQTRVEAYRLFFKRPAR
jgi:hypothetical protein